MIGLIAPTSAQIMLGEAMFRCNQCNSTYESLPQDACCPRIECFGEPLVEIQDAAEDAAHSERARGDVIEGLCILVCDASYSMDEPAFPPDDTSKLDLVATAVEKAVNGLSGITKRDTAYIAIIAFGRDAWLLKGEDGKPFIKSISQIGVEFPEGIGRYLRAELGVEASEGVRGWTDISSALKMARELYNDVLNDCLGDWIDDRAAGLINHGGIITKGGEMITFPNVRVMIYSDGAHNPMDERELENPFEDMQPSPLMTAFIGEESADEDLLAGAEQMKQLANVCPIHGQKGYFLINTIERHAVLKGLFHMASGATGFCPQCLKASGLLLLPAPSS